MGGNVFKDGSTRRFSAEEYFALLPTIYRLLKPISSRAVAIPAYASKESFGDADVLVIPSRSWDSNLLQNVFDLDKSHVVHNGGVWSISFEGIQVDLITTNEMEFDYALAYFSFNDRGNLIGKIAHKFGLKHGHNGLYFPIRSADHLLGEVLLTVNPTQAEQFLDVTPIRSFLTLEDIFKNVISSHYFNPSIYAFPEMNAVARIRDKKRSTYNAFLKYIEKFDPEDPYKIFFNFNPDKTVYYEMIFKEFPHAKVEFDQLWARKNLIEAAAEKFNGDIVSKLTERTGKNLGLLMIELKKTLTPEVIITMNEVEITETILETHNHVDLL